MSLTFYEKSHRYKLDGKWIPGVTTLIKGGLPAPALMYWSAKSVAEYVADNADDVDALRRMGRGPMVQALKEVPWQKRDRAGERGTEVHELVEKAVAGEPVDVPEILAGYVQAGINFMDDWGIKPLVVERPLAHRSHWWAGKPDLFAETSDGTTWLFDWKTADSGIWPEAAFQLAAYSHAEFYDDNGTERPIPKVDRCAAVWLQPGHYEVIPLKADDAVYNEFRHIAYVSQAAKRAKGDRYTPGYVGEPISQEQTAEEPEVA